MDAATTITFSCTSCRQPTKVAHQLAGKRVKCPYCGAILRVPVPRHLSETASDGTSDEYRVVNESPSTRSSPAAVSSSENVGHQPRRRRNRGLADRLDAWWDDPPGGRMRWWLGAAAPMAVLTPPALFSKTVLAVMVGAACVASAACWLLGVHWIFSVAHRKGDLAGVIFRLVVPPFFFVYLKEEWDDYRRAVTFYFSGLLFLVWATLVMSANVLIEASRMVE